ncbi:glycosylphosphatidylinositol anchor biosynthesis [Hanseniaspora vineae]
MQLLHQVFLAFSMLVLFVSCENNEHTNNWAVLVCTSRFWFNYRHMANTLSMYRTVKRLGIPDSQIILMLSDDVSCNSRNLYPGAVFNNMDHSLDLYGESVEVDYRGYEVTVNNFIRLLTDRWDEDQPKNKRLLTDENSNIFIYMTGHGGEDFLKFQDAEEIASQDIADAFQQMHEKKRYNEIFFMIDTCQANTMYSKFYSPNILAMGSSELDESSYSHHSDVEIGIAIIDRFTFFALEYLEKIKEKNSNLSIQDLFDYLTFERVHSHAGMRTDLYGKNASQALITDFFGSVQEFLPDTAVVDLENSKTVLDLAVEQYSEPPETQEYLSKTKFVNAKHAINNNVQVGQNQVLLSDDQIIKKYSVAFFILLSTLFFGTLVKRVPTA